MIYTLKLKYGPILDGFVRNYYTKYYRKQCLYAELNSLPNFNIFKMCSLSCKIKEKMVKKRLEINTGSQNVMRTAMNKSPVLITAAAQYRSDRECLRKQTDTRHSCTDAQWPG